MRLGTKSIRESVYLGMVQGVVAWTAYGVVEYWFSSVVPLITQSNFRYTSWHLGFTALLFGLYAGIGLIVGGFSGLALGMASRRFPFLRNAQSAILSAVGTFTVVLAFTLNLILRFRLGLAILALLSISLLMTTVLVLSVGSNVWSRGLRFVTNPWTTTIILLGLSWITLGLLGNHSRAVKAAALFAYPVAIGLISFVVYKMGETRRTRKFRSVVRSSPPKSLAFLAAVVIGILGISLFLVESAPLMAASSKASSLSPNRPNVLLIIMDTVRADHLSLYGYERDNTPNLRNFSDNATLYTRGIASGDITLSTHASIFTGLYARQHGAHFDAQGYGRPLADKFHTLAEMLGEKGYLTMGVVANHVFFGNGFGLEQGFDYFDPRETMQHLILHRLGHTRKFYLRQGIHRALVHFASQSDLERHYRKAEDINREAVALLEKARNRRERFFLFVNYMDAHWPYIPPPPFDTLYPSKDKSFNTSQHFNLLREVVKKRDRGITEEERRHLLSQYDGGIAYLDSQLGELIARLKELGLYENCLIIITSDHGEAFGERDLIEHGTSVYQDQVHIPLIIKYPSTKQKASVDHLVSVVDLMPTILDVLDYEIPKDVHGQSLLRLDLAEERNVISESYPNVTFLGPRFLRIERAILSGSFKFISSTAGKRELYNLAKDPDEKENLYHAEQTIGKEIEGKLKQWLKTVTREPDSFVRLEKGTLDRLKSLGYLQ